MVGVVVVAVAGMVGVIVVAVLTNKSQQQVTDQTLSAVRALAQVVEKIVTPLPPEASSETPAEAPVWAVEPEPWADPTEHDEAFWQARMDHEEVGALRPGESPIPGVPRADLHST